MRHLACVLLLLTACKKSEPAKSTELAPAPGSAAPAAAPEPAPAPTPPPAPPPPPPAKDPNAAAVDAAIDILNAVAPVTKEWGDEGDACAKKGIPEVDKVLETKKPQLAVIQEIHKTPETSIAFIKTFFKQDESALTEARSAALGPALHCAELSDHIQAALGLKVATAPKKKK